MARKQRVQVIGLDEAPKHTACGTGTKLVSTWKICNYISDRGDAILQENIDKNSGDGALKVWTVRGPCFTARHFQEA